MSEILINTQADGSVRCGFGWKRIKKPSGATKDELWMLKRMVCDLPDLKNYCKYFENKRRTLFEMAGIRPGEITFLNIETVKKLLSLPLSEGDKKGLYAYFDASTKIMAIEMGMEDLPNGQYREIAYDRYYGRMSYDEIMRKYGVSINTVWRAINRTSEYLAEYVRWYKDLATQVQNEPSK